MQSRNCAAPLQLSLIHIFLPIAAAGCDIDKLMAGAREGMKKYSADDNNDGYNEAALRNILYRKGKSVEMLVSYDPSFTMMGEW